MITKKDTKGIFIMNKKTNQKTSKKNKTTFDEFMETLSPREKRKFETECKEFALSELILAIMEEDAVSVRALAKLAGVSPTIIQAMRSGTPKDFSMKSFFKVLNGLGFDKIIIGRTGQSSLPLDISHLYKR